MDKPDFATIPLAPGVYLYKDAAGHIIYVGKARVLRRRVASYFREDTALTPKTVAMLRHAASIDIITTGTEKEALLLEASLIKKHRPRYNIVLRDDKQYVLFRIGRKHPYPRLEVVRKVRRDGARYFGPFTSAGAARETWKIIHKAFPLRRCTDRAFTNRVRACLYHHIGQCLGPCVHDVPQAEYAAVLHRVEQLLAGRSREVVNELATAMAQASDALEFELAARLRDQIRAVERTVERQAAVLPGGGDMDVTGIVETRGGLALGLLFVREGTLIDTRSFFWPGLGLEEAPELLWTFLAQYYDALSVIPPRIVVPWLPGDRLAVDVLPQGPVALPGALPLTSHGAAPDPLASMSGADVVDVDSDTHGALEAALADLRGGIVRIALPRNEEENRLVDMAGANAREGARQAAETPLPELLQRGLHLAAPPVRIEAVDVSHTSGMATRVGLVVFEDGKPLRSAYRSYAFADGGGDDYGILAQWAARRVESGPPWPDLLLVDGGRGQLAAVVRSLEEAMTTVPFSVAAITKARDDEGRADRRAGNVSDRIFLPGRSNPLPLRPGSPELLFLQHVRDTVHDYAIGRHRRARANEAMTGELQRIRGVGPQTARLLWDRFGSIAAMVEATEADLAALPGVGVRRARALHGRLKELIS